MITKATLSCHSVSWVQTAMKFPPQWWNWHKTCTNTQFATMMSPWNHIRKIHARTRAQTHKRTEGRGGGRMSAWNPPDNRWANMSSSHGGGLTDASTRCIPLDACHQGDPCWLHLSLFHLCKLTWVKMKFCTNWKMFQSQTQWMEPRIVCHWQRTAALPIVILKFWKHCPHKINRNSMT